MTRLLAAIFGWPLVWTEDHDGEVRLRRVYRTPFGRTMCRGICEKVVILHADGTTTGRAAYVKRWKPANAKAQTLFSEEAA